MSIVANKVKEKDLEFVTELIKFFKSAICGSAESVKTLANIEEKFPTQYEQLKKSKIDPSQIDKIMGEMNQKDKDVMLTIFAKSSYIAPKLNNLFELSLEEKKELAKTIDEFGDFVEEKLKNMVKPS